MITEKQIEKHKFFTTNGTDIWRVMKVSTFTLVELQNCETGGLASARIGGDGNAKDFVPVRMPKVKKPNAELPVKKAEKKKKAKTEKGPAAGGTRRGCTPGKKSSSKYFGVTVKVNKSGKKRFYAQLSRKGKWTNLGSYNIEEEAAAAVQDYIGNKEEAARLRIIVAKKTKVKINQVEGATAYDCTGCGKGYPFKPNKCGKCGSSSFSPARPEEREVEK